MIRKNQLLRLKIISTIFIMILGVLFHFTYEWSNENLLVGTFSSINESTWEHLKLVFFPMLISLIIGYIYIGNKIPNYICAKVQGIISAMLITIVLFYTYTGIIGTNYSIVDISIFFISIALGQYIVYKIIKSKSNCNNLMTSIILLVIYLCFIIFTFFPPYIEMFKDPITGMYGI